MDIKETPAVPDLQFELFYRGALIKTIDSKDLGRLVFDKILYYYDKANENRQDYEPSAEIYTALAKAKKNNKVFGILIINDARVIKILFHKDEGYISIYKLRYLINSWNAGYPLPPESDLYTIDYYTWEELDKKDIDYLIGLFETEFCILVYGPNLE